MSDRDRRDDELVDALRQLPRELPPPPHVAAALSSAFATAPADRAPNRSRVVWQAAAAAVLVIAAFAAGRVTAARPAVAPAGDQKFMFLLYGGPTGGGDDRAAEYGKWAVELRRAGHNVSGERLADAAWTAGTAAGDPLPLRGFFIIGARDSAEALALARKHPHSRDGTVVVRPVDTP